MEGIDKEIKIDDNLSVLPIRDIVMFPYMVMPLIVGRENSKAAVDFALNNNHIIFLACQKDASIETPTSDDIYETGTISSILRMIKMPDGKMKILVQGLKRGKIESFSKTEPCYVVKINELEDLKPESDYSTEARVRNVKERLTHAVNIGKPILPDLLAVLETITDAGKLADIIAANLGLRPEDAQSILELNSPDQRLDKVTEFLNREISILEVQQKIFSDAKGEIDKGQREYFLREQLKAIKRELGEDDINSNESDEYKRKIKKAKMPKDVKAEAEKQLMRLKHMHQESAEANVVRNYLDWLTDLPWSKYTKDNLDLKHASEVLDEDHYGL